MLWGFIMQAVPQQPCSTPTSYKTTLGIICFVAINVALIGFLLLLGHHFNFYCFSIPINALRCSSKESVQIAKEWRRMTMTWPLALP